MKNPLRGLLSVTNNVTVIVINVWTVDCIDPFGAFFEHNMHGIANDFAHTWAFVDNDTRANGLLHFLEANLALQHTLFAMLGNVKHTTSFTNANRSTTHDVKGS